MSNQSNDIGRAFEYACLCMLESRIRQYRPVWTNTMSAAASERAWNSIDVRLRNSLNVAANAFIDTLFQAEPRILECNGDGDVVILSVNSDNAAEEGDVRDIVIQRGSIQWDVGLSIKHNHFAAKHSRLSASIDFGSKWYGIPCSELYWQEVRPIFYRLNNLKAQGVLWRDIPNKDEMVYVPLLGAFMEELYRAYRSDLTLPKRLIAYLLGVKDFYKVVAVDSSCVTRFQGFNLRGELNKDGQYTRATIFVPIVDLPDRIVGMEFKTGSTNTIELYCDKGWALSFRIHNASSRVEPSLKFDIQLLGVPANIMTINCVWR